MPAPAFMKLKVDHKTVLCRDLNTYRSLRDFLLNSGYVGVYETERVGEEKTAMATFACRSGLTGGCLAVVMRLSAPNEVSHAQAPFEALSPMTTARHSPVRPLR